MVSEMGRIVIGHLALGRIVEVISKSQLWKHAAILVIEDDSQDGFDHVETAVPSAS
jgi:hypothetical protein